MPVEPLGDGRKRVRAPLSDEDVRALHAGDVVLLSGTVYVARDAAHKKLLEDLDAGIPLPFDPTAQIVYYAGPTPERPGNPIGSAGPTTSMRLDPYTVAMLELGLKGIIGKGGRGPAIREALGRAADRPAGCENLEQLPQRFELMDPDPQAVKRFIARAAESR